MPIVWTSIFAIEPNFFFEYAGPTIEHGFEF
jgi:hypothetical protein